MILGVLKYSLIQFVCFNLKRTRRLSPEDIALESLGKTDPEGFELRYINSFIGWLVIQYMHLSALSAYIQQQRMYQFSVEAFQ